MSFPPGYLAVSFFSRLPSLRVPRDFRSAEFFFALGSAAKASAVDSTSLDEFGYGDVSLDSEIHEQQLKDTHAVLID